MGSQSIRDPPRDCDVYLKRRLATDLRRMPVWQNPLYLCQSLVVRFAEKMTISQAIRKAEQVLPGKEAPEGELDSRWQAIIAVSDHIENHPDKVWSFTRKWGAHANADLRCAVATCLLEHLLEHHFDRIFPLVSEACRRSERFGDTFCLCGEFGQTAAPRNLKRFRSLKTKVSAQSAKKMAQRGRVSRSTLRREFEHYQRVVA